MSLLIDKSSSLESLDQAGGKAFNLFLMDREGLPIPTWTCLSSRAFKEVYDQNKDFILAKIQKIKLNELSSIEQAALDIEAHLIQIEISDEIKQALDSFLVPGRAYAVRSSAVGEDGSDRSYAGQLSSFLNISAGSIDLYLKKCWASLFSVRNIQYRLINEIHDPPEMGVIIQEVIEAQCSGVLFTAHPLLEEGFLDKVVINAGYGLGEGVVSDQVQVDTFVFSKSQKKIIDSVHQIKKDQLIFNPKSDGLLMAAVDPSQQNASVLNNAQVSKLVALGLQVRSFLGPEQDLEWCLDQKGEIYLTQTRPITTIKRGVNKLDFLFDNSNIVESFPGVNTPWTLGQVKDVYRIAFKRTCLRLGFNRKEINKNNYLFYTLLGMYRGRIYLNLTHWYGMMRMIPFTDNYVKTWEEMLGVKPDAISSDSKRSLGTYFRAIYVFSRISLYFVFLDVILGRLDKQLREIYRRFWHKEKRQHFLSLTPAESIDELEKFKSEIFENSEFTLINDIYAFIFTGLTKKLIEKFTSEDPDKSFNDLLFGIAGMDSIKPLNELKELALFVKERPELKSELVIIEKMDSFNLNFLSKKSVNQEFKNRFENYIDEFGDRGTSELKLESLTYREAPQSLLRLILSYADQDLENETTGAQVLDFKTFEKSYVKSIWKGALLKFSLKMAIRSIIYRENFRLHRSRAYGILRRMTINIGEKISALGELNHGREIFFLEKADLYNFYSGLAYDINLKSRVIHNKQLYHQYLQEEPFPRYTVRQGKFDQLISEGTNSSEGLEGTGCSSGKVIGEVIVIKDIEKFSGKVDEVKNKILVAKMTDPGWVFLMASAKGLIVEKGSLLSHTAIIGRELGIPTIVGVEGATEVISSGDKIEMDAQTGKIRLLS